MDQAINWIWAHKEDLLSLVGGAAVLAATLPRPASGRGALLFKVLDLLAANFGQARNANNKPG